MTDTDTCVFCGKSGTDFRPEHWVSQWISRATIPEGKGIQHHAPGREPWIERIVDYTVDHICPDCNHHWMSDQETKIRDVALPFIEGDTTPRTVRAHDVQRLAAWCFMKIITLELGRPSEQTATYPPEIYKGFCRFKRPPHGCLLSLGYRDIAEDPPAFVWFRSQGQNQPHPQGIGDLPGYRTTLTIKHLVIDLIGVLANVTLQVQDMDDRFVQVWPDPADLDWPPPRRFHGIVNDDLE